MKQPSAGYIFLCSDQTEQECLEKSLFGGQEKYQGRVKGLQPGHTLFLYNYKSKKLHGVFKALTEVKKDIIPGAWKGEFPWQVKVERIDVVKALSREDIPREILKFDIRHRPSSRLDQAQVDALLKLFKNKKRAKTYADDLPYTTEDGHKVRSMAEQRIDNWLYKNRIAHGYETQVGAKQCDFQIPLADGTSVYIEYWGLNDKKYLKDKEAKIKLYKEKRLSLIELTPLDKDIELVLEKKLSAYIKIEK